MHQAFYRKYRPRVFDDVYGQDHITSVLRYECASDSVSHAYLFCGSRGTGKTTCAKILAKAINCESPVNGNPCGVCPSCRAIEDGSATDVVEMDAASNNGVDNIRELRDEVVYTPSMLKKRVYIIDEVHMLTQSAFNALLKTLEEPPEYVVFILATTELHKLPATITSRCQRFDFRRITVEMLIKRLEYIASEEHIALTHDAAARISRIAEGGMRDAISLFELCAGGGADVDIGRVESVLGLSLYDNLRRFADSVAKKDLAALLSMIAEVQASSKDIAVFWSEIASFWRDMMIMKVSPDPTAYLDLTEVEHASLYEAARLFAMNELAFHVGIIDDAQRSMARSPQSRRQIAEFAVLRLVSPQFDSSTDALLARISALEEKVSLLEMGVASASPRSVVQSNDAAPVERDKTPQRTEQPVSSAVLPEAAEAAESEPDERASAKVDAPEQDSTALSSDTSGGHVMTEIADPSLLAEKLGPLGDMYRSYIMGALVETNDAGNLIRITVDKSFAKTMLSSAQAKELISRAAMLARLVSVPPEVEIILREQKGEGRSEFIDF